MKTRKTKPNKKSTSLLDTFIEHIYRLNSSKFFTGIIMLTVNIGSKYITLQLSESQEQFIKYTLGRQILVFAILWMGTRDIVTALTLTIIFIIFADYLFNDNSKFCIISHKYTEKVKDTENHPITQKQINDAIHILKRARSHKQNGKSEDNDYYIKKGLYKENFI